LETRIGGRQHRVRLTTHTCGGAGVAMRTTSAITQAHMRCSAPVALIRVGIGLAVAPTSTLGGVGVRRERSKRSYKQSLP
jgi:hypothetical protein